MRSEPLIHIMLWIRDVAAAVCLIISKKVIFFCRLIITGRNCQSCGQSIGASLKIVTFLISGQLSPLEASHLVADGKKWFMPNTIVNIKHSTCSHTLNTQFPCLTLNMMIVSMIKSSSPSPTPVSVISCKSMGIMSSTRTSVCCHTKGQFTVRHHNMLLL